MEKQEPNRIAWKSGDLVLHESDAKNYRMLMRVIGYKGELCRTVYVYGPEYIDEEGNVTVWENKIGVLHNPAKFGVDVNKVVTLKLSPVDVLRILHHIRERERTLTYPILNQLDIDWQCW